MAKFLVFLVAAIGTCMIIIGGFSLDTSLVLAGCFTATLLPLILGFLFVKGEKNDGEK